MGLGKMDLHKIEHLKEKGKVDKLEKYTSSSDDAIREAAFAAIGSISKEESANILIAGISDAAPSVRLAIAKGLANVGDHHSEELIRHQMEKETDAEVKEAFRAAIAAIKEKR